MCACAPSFNQGKYAVSRQRRNDVSEPIRGICMEAGIKHPSRVGSELVLRRVSCSYATFRTVRR